MTLFLVEGMWCSVMIFLFYFFFVFTCTYMNYIVWFGRVLFVHTLKSIFVISYRTSLFYFGNLTIQIFFDKKTWYESNQIYSYQTDLSILLFWIFWGFGWCSCFDVELLLHARWGICWYPRENQPWPLNILWGIIF